MAEGKEISPEGEEVKEIFYFVEQDKKSGRIRTLGTAPISAKQETGLEGEVFELTKKQYFRLDDCLSSSGPGDCQELLESYKPINIKKGG